MPVPHEAGGRRVLGLRVEKRLSAVPLPDGRIRGPHGVRRSELFAS